MSAYGFQRLVLLNSAGYQRAELPLDAAVSLVAPNNTGKTSLINALQFLLIIDKRRMDFGAHDVDVSRRFYFPSNSTYILLEVALPNGSVVLGCVGQGVSHEYAYFAYKGSLDVEQYCLPHGALVSEPDLVKHMATHGMLVHRYSSTEFAEGIYGRRKKTKDTEPDFAVFKLEQPGQSAIFQRVLTRTLRLDKLRSDEVKGYLLEIFRQDMPDHTIDFKTEWDKAFGEVNADRAQYDAAFKSKSAIDVLEGLQQERLTLRGKILHLRPRIDQGLQAWEGYYRTTSSAFHEQIKQIQRDEQGWALHHQDLIRQQMAFERALEELQRTNSRHEYLRRELALVTDSILDARLQEAKARRDEQTALVQQASTRGRTAILNDQRSVKRDMELVDRKIDSLTDNLFLALKSSLPARAVDKLNRLLSAQAMTQSSQKFFLDAVALATWLEATEDIHLPGLRIALDGLELQYSQETIEELKLRRAELSQQAQSLIHQLEVADALEAAHEEKRRLEDIVRAIEGEIDRFNELQQLEASAEQRRVDEQELTEQLNNIAQALENMKRENARLRDAEGIARAELDKLQRHHEVIIELRERREDEGSVFAYLEDRPHQPWIGLLDVPLDGLARHLQGYQADCRRLVRVEDQIRSQLSDLHAAGLTKFQFAEGGPEREIERVIEFGAHLPQELAAIERKARTAVVNVAVSLRTLRDGLLAIQSKMRHFNSLISRRRLSDLAVFRIKPVEEAQLVEAMEMLITTAEQADRGETFDLFNHASVLDDDTLNRAKLLLIQEGNARGGLKIEHFFRLEFVVGKEDKAEESFADIDSAASNGTVLMAKLVTGLALLHLMQDKRHQIQAICYLDEATALDQRNQRSLIDTAGEFGFALIFASPSPLLTVRYCVPITVQSGHNHISRKHWQIFERLDA